MALKMVICAQLEAGQCLHIILAPRPASWATHIHTIARVNKTAADFK